jgi:putative MATE family efflux protein
MMILFFVFSSAMRGAGDARTPLVVMAVANVINIGLDPLLIFGCGPFPALGVAGAAIASVLSQAVLVFMGLYFLLAGSSHLHLRVAQLFALRPRWGVRLLRIGAPAALGDLLRTLVALVTALVVLTFGTETMAAFGVGSRLLFCVFVPISAIGTAISALVGQNLGARKPERATRAVINGTFIGLAVAFLISLAGFVLPRLIMRIFTNDPVVIEFGVPLLRIGSFAIVGVAVATCHASAFWGAGDTVPPMLVWIVATAGVQLPILLLSVFVFGTGATYVWMSVSVGAIAGMALIAAWLARGRWLRKKL